MGFYYFMNQIKSIPQKLFCYKAAMETDIVHVD